MSAGKKTALGAFVLVLLAFLFLVEEHFRGKIELANWKARMEAQGEVFDVHRLAPPPVPAHENGMPALVWAGSQLSGLSRDLYVPHSRYAAPGKGVVIWREKAWPVSRARDATNMTWEIVDAALQKQAAGFSNVFAALEHPSFCGNLDYSGGFSMLLAHLTPLKAVAQATAAAVLSDLHAGHKDDAVTKLEALIRVTVAFGDEPTIISQLVRIATMHIAFATTWQALQAGLTGEQLAGLQRAWVKVDMLPGMERALQMERAMGAIEAERFRDSNKGFDAGFGMAQPAPPFSLSIDYFAHLFNPKLLRDSVVAPIWKFAWSRHDELHLLREYQQRLSEYRAAARARSFQSLSERDEESFQFPDASENGNDRRSFYDRIRFIFSRMIFPAIDNSARKVWVAQTTKELTVAAIALKRYELKHGRPPAALRDLVPEFVTEVPWDYMAGSELRYKLINGKGVLYSVGSDRVDDGGDPSSRSSTPNYQNGRDLVWPEPATPQEISAHDRPENP